MSRFKRCVCCRTEILKTLRICPHCDTRQPNLFLRYSLLTLLIIVVILGIIGINYLE
jgi:hypothetical protein